MPEPDGEEIQADAEPEEDEPLYQEQTQNAPLAETRRAGLAEQSAGKRA